MPNNVNWRAEEPEQGISARASGLANLLRVAFVHEWPLPYISLAVGPTTSSSFPTDHNRNTTILLLLRCLNSDHAIPEDSITRPSQRASSPEASRGGMQHKFVADIPRHPWCLACRRLLASVGRHHPPDPPCWILQERWIGLAPSIHACSLLLSDGPERPLD